jgi:hypothetical protein
MTNKFGAFWHLMVTPKWVMQHLSSISCRTIYASGLFPFLKPYKKGYGACYNQSVLMIVLLRAVNKHTMRKENT